MSHFYEGSQKLFTNPKNWVGGMAKHFNTDMLDCFYHFNLILNHFTLHTVAF